MYVLTRLKPEPNGTTSSIIEIFESHGRNSRPIFTTYNGLNGTLIRIFPTLDSVMEYRKNHKETIDNTIIVSIEQLSELFDGSIRADCYRMEYGYNNFDCLYFAK